MTDTYFRDRSLFIAWGWGGGILGGSLDIWEKKGGIIRNWEPKVGDRWKFWKDSEGGPIKLSWKMKTWEEGGGTRKSSKVIRGHHYSAVAFKGGIDQIPPFSQVINNDRPLNYTCFTHRKKSFVSCWDLLKSVILLY